MDIFTDPQELTGFVWRIKRNYHLKLWEETRAKPGYIPLVGFVPTMGALHEGHMSLVRKSVEENHFTVVSIFVNPLQFGPSEDLGKYPRPFEKDKAMLEEAGVDALLAPDAAKFYPDGFQTRVAVAEVTKGYCGERRPGHFDGVTTVVAKLFGIVMPDRAYFGEKDYQQLQAVKRMVQDLSFPLQIVAMPTVRETDGLACSSRNRYLSDVERNAAPGLFASLVKLKKEFLNGIADAHRLVQIGMSEMMRLMGFVDGFGIEYLEIADPETLKRREMDAEPGDVALAAVHFGSTRLIDNIRLSESETAS